MAQVSNQITKSFIANESIPAYVIVSLLTNGTVEVWDTLTSNQIGASRDAASTGQSIEIVIGGTCKLLAAASVSAGSVVGPATASTAGYVLERSVNASTTTKTFGVALDNADTNSVCEVLININNLVDGQAG